MDQAERTRLREQTESVVIAAYPSAASWMTDTPYGVTRQPVSEDRRVAVDRLLVLALLRALDAAEITIREYAEVLAERNGQMTVARRERLKAKREREAARAELARCREAFFAMSARAATLHSALDCLVQEIVEDGVYFTNLADARAALAATTTEEQ